MAHGDKTYKPGDIYDMTNSDLAEFIADLSYTISVGDDWRMDVSNIGRAVTEEMFGEFDSEKVGEALDRISRMVAELDK